MNVRWYAHFFDDAGFHLWSMIGCPLRIFGLETIKSIESTVTSLIAVAFAAGIPPDFMNILFS